MNREQLYYKTLTVVSEAYKNRTLVPRDSNACVVAHLIVHNMGFKFKEFSPDGIPAGWETAEGVEISTCWWYGLVGTDKVDELYDDEKYLASTGYTKKELRRLIRAFDGPYYNSECRSNVEIGFNAVLKALKEIHEREPTQEELNPVTQYNNSAVDSWVKRYESATRKRKLVTITLCLLLMAAVIALFSNSSNHEKKKQESPAHPLAISYAAYPPRILKKHQSKLTVINPKYYSIINLNSLKSKA